MPEEATFELNKIEETKQKLHRDDLIYKRDDKKKAKAFDFQKFKTIKSYGR